MLLPVLGSDGVDQLRSAALVVLLVGVNSVLDEAGSGEDANESGYESEDLLHFISFRRVVVLIIAHVILTSKSKRPG